MLTGHTHRCCWCPRKHEAQSLCICRSCSSVPKPCLRCTGYLRSGSSHRDYPSRPLRDRSCTRESRRRCFRLEAVENTLRVLIVLSRLQLIYGTEVVGTALVGCSIEVASCIHGQSRIGVGASSGSRENEDGLRYPDAPRLEQSVHRARIIGHSAVKSGAVEIAVCPRRYPADR